MKKKVVILGSTGSIGKSLFSILKNDKDNFEIYLLTANSNYKELLKQVKIFKVKNIIITNKLAFIKIQKILINEKINIYNDFNSINKIFQKKEIDYVMSAISGFNGLKPTLSIIKFCKKIAIANKESIICGWSLIKKSLKYNKTQFIPVDSEHFSIWSLLENLKNNSIEKVYITASGGPFRKYPLSKFKSITPTMALKHPNWSMGKKISIDSATMMNKVFEIIEAKKIFNLSYNQLEIIVHPHSYLHAIIKFNNGLTKLLIHDTNMKIPIFNSLYSDSYKKIKSEKLSLKKLNNLNLEKIDKKRFPLVEFLDKLKNNNSLFETVIVAANDCLVKLFLEKKIKFTDISRILLKTLNMTEFKKYKKIAPKNINQITKLSNYVSLKINNMSV
ncbi:1-deoxy-D-xylulose-5-phosphate reductoisomerase [Candidatus Pelagibacter sp. Uisw_090]|uniref:1-deoxy-D-xylulose-5-phosphate reductoisomerase n=1 Tax=Candidatus Pelagibacter sp. Uisw_090 TaxID=3230993 RepID=UPI0039E79472